MKIVLPVLRLKRPLARTGVLQEEERRRMTLEALADVDAGRVVDHQIVQAWVAGLK